MGKCARCKKNEGSVFDTDYGLVCIKCWDKGSQEYSKKMADAIKRGDLY